MPLDLPGFYFDVARNRYFPINSQVSRSNYPSFGTGPVPKDHSVHVASNEVRGLRKPSRERNTKIQRDMMNALGSNERFDALQYVISNTLKLENNNPTNYFDHSKLRASKLTVMTAKCSSVAPYDSLGVDLTSLAVSEQIVFAGDKTGMLYFGSPNVPDAPWSVHYHLESQIISVHSHQGTTYAASLGPQPQILVTTDEYTARFSMHAFHDVWAVHWITSESPFGVEDGSTTSIGSAVLGMKQRAVYMPSLETHRGCYIMPTNADVFAVQKHHSQILTGARNGSVKLFDIRAPPTSHCTIFQPCVRTGRSNGGGWDTLAIPSSQLRRNTPSPSKLPTIRPTQAASSIGHASAVTNLRVINEWGLLLAAMDGTLALYDIRFCGAGSKSESHPSAQSRGSSSETSSPRPVMALTGHINTHSQNLGFCVDPSSNFVFAAGEDNKVRAWSLKTGETIFGTVQQDSDERQKAQGPSKDRWLLALKKFARPVNALVLSSSGRDLWVASGRDVFCYESPLQIM